MAISYSIYVQSRSFVPRRAKEESGLLYLISIRKLLSAAERVQTLFAKQDSSTAILGRRKLRKHSQGKVVISSSLGWCCVDYRSFLHFPRDNVLS